MKTFAVVPAYNENPEKLARVLANLKNYVDDIVVVDDGSAIAISNFQFPISNLTLLRHEINRGQGAALQTGTDFAVKNGAEIIIHFDGDGQHDPEDIRSLIKPIEKGRADFVFGSRYKEVYPERIRQLAEESREPVPQLSSANYSEYGSKRDPSPRANQSGVQDKVGKIPWTKRRIIHPLARLVNYLLTGLNLSDAHNGLRAFSARIADKVYLSQDRMAHATEYLQLVKQNKIRYTEVVVRIDYQEYGQGIKGGLKVVRELLTEKIIKS